MEMTGKRCPQCDGYGTTLNTAVVSIIHDMSRSLENKRKQMDEYFKACPEQYVLESCSWCKATGRIE